MELGPVFIEKPSRTKNDNKKEEEEGKGREGKKRRKRRKTEVERNECKSKIYLGKKKCKWITSIALSSGMSCHLENF